MEIINILKLHSELKNNGFNICGVDSNGIISWLEPPTKDQSQRAKKILDEFDDIPDPDNEKISRFDNFLIANIVEKIAIKVGLASEDGKIISG